MGVPEPVAEGMAGVPDGAEGFYYDSGGIIDNHSTCTSETTRVELSLLAKEQEPAVRDQAATPQARSSTPRFRVVC
ncbi:hypothetical protein DL765_006317 [Monosporascus sp. GIB2]|nr:hypothetical protein DL765_006317 [Monosporascus sp. GIB2]